MPPPCAKVGGMNIFVLDTDPKVCAEMTQDVHITKMPLETAQMLCSAYPKGTAPYKPTHYNHPCTVWARQSLQNFDWLLDLGEALCAEFEYRRGKQHACQSVIEGCRRNPPRLESAGLTKFALAMPDRYKVESGVQSYRDYYVGEKQGYLHRGRWVPASYTNRPRPAWFIEVKRDC